MTMITRKVGLVAALLALLTATGAAATQVAGTGCPFCR